MGSVVEINPFTRVEGHGNLKVYLDGARVERVELCLSESPRLFEALLVGRGFAEVPDIICRICSLCSTVHKVTALLALENAFGVEVSRVTELTRALILNGGQIENARRLAYYTEAATTALAGLDDVTVQRASWRFPSPARVGLQQ